MQSRTPKNNVLNFLNIDRFMRYMIIVNFDKMKNVEKQWQDYSVHIIDTEYPFFPSTTFLPKAKK